MEFPTEDIRGFDSPLQYRQFARVLTDCLRAGTAVEVEADARYVAGDIVGGDWFKDTATGRIWRLVAPADAFAGVWEQVYVA